MKNKKNKKVFQTAPNNCPVCQEQLKTKQNFQFIQNYKSNDGEFTLYQCPNCEVQFWMPFKNPGPDWYEKYQVYDQLFYTKPKVRCGYHKKILRIFKNQTIKEKKFLDLGCGTGEFISALERKGLQVWGVDFSQVFIDIARENFNLKNVFVCSFTEFFQKSELPKFNYISLFEVIEHLDNPKDFLQSVRKFLKQEGIIIISVPCRERILVNWFKGEFPFHHLSRWNRESLTRFLNKNGFKVETVYYVDSFRFIFETLMGITSFGFLRKIRKREKEQESQKREKTLKKKFLIRLLYFLIGIKKIILCFFAFILFIFGKLFKRKNGDILCLAKINNLK